MPELNLDRLTHTMGIYIDIARPVQWTKHVLVIPGIIAAFLLEDGESLGLITRLVTGSAGACLVASANYVLNEWVDSAYDRLHPVKCNRPGARGVLSRRIVVTEYVVLAGSGLILARLLGREFLCVSLFFLVTALFYNLKPFRTKDIPYLDVITEALNSPVRVIIGWQIAAGHGLPPLLLLVIFWLGGASSMTLKRLAELRLISRHRGHEPARYRTTFHYYTERSLMILSLVYGVLASLLLLFFCYDQSGLVLKSVHLLKIVAYKAVNMC
jgi:decaprenyl-phosphate phosphoribosyltransferase